MTALVTIKAQGANVKVYSELIADRERLPNGDVTVADGSELSFVVDDVRSLRVDLTPPEPVPE